MTFLNPAFFYLFLLSIPITLLYLFRLRRRRVQVSTLMFWEQVLRDAETAALLHRLKRWVSLLCQIAFLALVALAATRPLLPGYEQARRRLIALVDISASMNAMDVQGGRIQAARDIALSLVDRLGPADEMMLIAVDDAPHILVPFTDDPKLLRSAIKAIQAGQARTDFTAAVNLALRLPSNGFKKEVYLVSDGNFPTVQAKPPDGVAVFHAAVGRSDNNLAITTCEARTLATSPRDYEVLLTAQNSSDRERKVNVELYLDDRLADVRPLSLRPQEVRAETFAGIRLAGSRITAVLDAADDLPLDNKAYAVLPRLDPLKVLLVTQGNPFLEAALASDEALEATATLPATYHAAEGYDVVIFDGWSPDRVDRGKFVFINSDMKALALGNSGQVAAAA
ncbi:MAG: VWA domain-containing protein, partial [Planctomycetes bacterium]|nr:VWA domain-containing protein [Planctomycetota bacterium]